MNVMNTLKPVRNTFLWQQEQAWIYVAVKKSVKAALLFGFVITPPGSGLYLHYYKDDHIFLPPATSI